MYVWSTIFQLYQWQLVLLVEKTEYSAPSVYRPSPHFIANLAYRQNSRLSRFPPLKIPRYTATQLPPSATAFQTQKS